MMAELEKSSGPFTNAEEIQIYLADSSIPDSIKQKRLKKEIQFARESSTTLPKVDPIFKIKISQANKKRWDKTTAEFEE